MTWRNMTQFHRNNKNRIIKYIRPSERLLPVFSDGLRPCKTPLSSLLRRQEPSLKRSFSCLAGSYHQNRSNQIFDFIRNVSFSKIREASKALLCTGHPPARVRQIFGFVKLSACVFYKVLSAKACLQGRKHSKVWPPCAHFQRRRLQRNRRVFTPTFAAR